MGITKSNIFTNDVNRTAELAKAFAHPARISIIKHLIQVKGCIVNDLVELVGLSQSTISQHLKELKTIGIIKGEIEGPRMCYCINEEVWEEAKLVFQDLFSSYISPNCC
ncbi:MAG: ArsR/SmtB family transcription factor [Candidatus Cyclobacteriaceae bacterium M3_2C_046]